jgi:hypothetical protein
MFNKKFDIIEEIELELDLGRELLTPELRNELTTYDDYELFSNKVSFVLQQRPHTPPRSEREAPRHAGPAVPPCGDSPASRATA